MKIKMVLRKFLKRVADWINEHWIWKTIILFIPSIYLPIIVKYFGEELALVTNDKLNHIGIIATVVIYSLCLIINILTSYKAKRDIKTDEEKERCHKKEIETYSNTLNVYGRLLNVIGNICDIKLDSIYSYINNSIAKGEFHKPFNETVYPDRQLRTIAKELTNCLSEITQPPAGNISVTMAYEFPKLGSDIKWIDTKDISSGMKLSKLKRDENTTFYQIYSGKQSYLFFNDKKEAFQKGRYVYDKKDDRHHNIGSIVCDEITIEDDKGRLARIILTISTYGYKFTDSSEKPILDNMSKVIEQVILQQFEKRIKIELALMYIKKQYNKR